MEKGTFSAIEYYHQITGTFHFSPLRKSSFYKLLHFLLLLDSNDKDFISLQVKIMNVKNEQFSLFK
jgi:hypothetical protein